LASPDMVHANLKDLIAGWCSRKHTHTHTHTHTYTHTLDTDIHIDIFGTSQCIKHCGRKDISSGPLRAHTHAHTHFWTHVRQNPGMHKT